MVKKKKLNFNINNFSKFKEKIEYIVLDKQPENLRIINDNDKVKIKKSKILDNALIERKFSKELRLIQI